MQKPIASWRRNKVNEINSVATPRFLDALDYAVRLHGTDVQRCTSIPYVAHLLGVGALALLDGGTEDEALQRLISFLPRKFFSFCQCRQETFSGTCP